MRYYKFSDSRGENLQFQVIKVNRTYLKTVYGKLCHEQQKLSTTVPKWGPFSLQVDTISTCTTTYLGIEMGTLRAFPFHKIIFINTYVNTFVEFPASVCFKHSFFLTNELTLGCSGIELLSLIAFEHYSPLAAYTDSIEGIILRIDDVLNWQRVFTLDDSAISGGLLGNAGIVPVHVVGGTNVSSDVLNVVTAVERPAVVRIGEESDSGALEIL
jgi:hypothetical protein